jgi:hypothetical protein
VVCAPLWLIGTVFAVWTSWGHTTPGRLAVVLAIPAVLCLTGSLLPERRFSRAAAWTLVVLLLLFVALSSFSIGLCYLPALLALLTAAILWQRPAALADPVDGRGPVAGNARRGSPNGSST